MPCVRRGAGPPAGWRPSVGGGDASASSTSQQHRPVGELEEEEKATASSFFKSRHERDALVQQCTQFTVATGFGGDGNSNFLQTQSENGCQHGGRTIHNCVNPVSLLDEFETQEGTKHATIRKTQDHIGSASRVGDGQFEPTALFGELHSRSTSKAAAVMTTREVNVIDKEVRGQVTLASFLEGLDDNDNDDIDGNDDVTEQPGKNSRTVSWVMGAEGTGTNSVAASCASRATLADSNLKASLMKAQKLIFDMDSFLVDFVLDWQKKHALASFSLIGRISDGLQEWSERVQERGKLSVDDFGGNGVELDLSGTTAFDESGSGSRYRCEQLANALRRDCSITCLRLSGARMGDTGCGWVAGAVMRNRTLRQLVLSDNLIRDEGLGSLVAVLDKNQTLTELDLSGNFITSEGAILLADGLRHNRCLKDLNLGLNTIGEDGANSLADALEPTTSKSRLRSLNLEGNLLGAHGCTRLGALLNNQTSYLEVLILPEEEEGQHTANMEASVLAIQSAAAHEPAQGEAFLVTCSEAGVDIGVLGFRRQQPSWLQDAHAVQMSLRDERLSRSNKTVVKVHFSVDRLRVDFEQSPILDVELCGLIQPTKSTWVLGYGVLRVTLAKADGMHWSALTASM